MDVGFRLLTRDEWYEVFWGNDTFRINVHILLSTGRQHVTVYRNSIQSAEHRCHTLDQAAAWISSQ